MERIQRIWLIAVLLLLVVSVRADGNRKAYPGGKCHLYRLVLKDKAGSPYTLSHPGEFLSEKALLRRQRQGLEVDSTDLPISPRYLNLLTEAGLQVVSRSKWTNTVVVALPQADDMGLLRELPFVSDVVRLFSSPDSVNVSSRNDLVATIEKWDTTSAGYYGHGREQIEMLGGMKLHEAGFRGQGMTIAVVDGGFMNADRMAALRNVSVVDYHDFVYPPSPDFFAELDHGTEVLSTMAANLPDTLVGTAPEARYLLLRSEDGRSESLAEEDFWCAAVEYADSIGADVVNSSLGYHHFDNYLGDHRYRDLDGATSVCSRAASMMAGKGMILVTSAGNEGLGTWKKINVPGDAYDVLTVGAVNSMRVNTGFSSLGPTADGRVKPDVMAKGFHAAVVAGNGRVTTANGTSFSSPITCGLVACLWQALPQCTALQVIDLVRQAGHQYDEPDNVFGYGLPNFWKALELGRTAPILPIRELRLPE